MTRFLVLFLVLLFGLSFIANIPEIRVTMIDPWNQWLANASYWLIQPFENIIYPLNGGGGVAIESGCNGIEAILILISAMLAFPGPWLAKVLGVVIGAALVQLLNLGRIISLYYLVQWDHEIFEWFHTYLWPTLIILDALIVFIIWTRILDKRYSA